MKRRLARFLVRLHVIDLYISDPDGHDMTVGWVIFYHCGRRWVSWVEVWYENDEVRFVRVPWERVREVRRTW